MQKLKTESKSQIASVLDAYAEMPNQGVAVAAIDALGELGGPQAVEIIERVLGKLDSGGESGPHIDERWEALLRAYGRAGRFMPDR